MDSVDNFWFICYIIINMLDKLKNIFTKQQALEKTAKETATERGEPYIKVLDTNVDPKNPETWGKVPRNALCPCGSGKKYKQCCGKL